MNFIRKIFEGKTDDWVHKQFTRYGKGTYENKALLDITKGKDSLKIKSSFEFAGEFAHYLAQTIQGKTHVTGGVISTKPLKEELGIPIANQKQFAGVKTYLIDTELTKEQITTLFTKFPNTMILLSFKTQEGELKTKVKSPTSAKPGKGGDNPKADFCTFTLKDQTFADDLAFDVKKSYKKLFINHTYIITALTVPKEYGNNLEQARLNAKRKGKILRKITLEEKEETTEKEFEA